MTGSECVVCPQGLLAGVELDHGRALRQRIGGKLREAVEVLEEYVAHLRSISDSAQLPKAEHELRRAQEALEMLAAPADTDDSMLEVDTVKVVVDIMTGLDVNVLVVSLVDQQDLGGHVTAAYSRTTHVALRELAVSGGGALELPSCSTVVLFFAHNHANSVLLGKVGDQKTEVEVLLDMAAETHEWRQGGVVSLGSGRWGVREWVAWEHMGMMVVLLWRGNGRELCC